MADSDLVSRPEDRLVVTTRPILWQARQDLAAFSKAQVIPALAMGIGTFATAWMLGQVTSWGSALVLVFGSVAVGVVLYAVLAILRAPFIVIAQHHRQISDVNQRLLDTEARLAQVSAMRQLPAPIPVAAKPEPKETNIVYLSAEIIEAHRQQSGGIYEGRGPYNSFNRRQEWFWACVASFRNEVLKDREIGGRGQVSAKITYVSEQQAGSKTSSRAAWFGTDRFHVTFGINDTHTLVVATFEDWKLFAIQQNSSGGRSDDHKQLPLSGDLHKVHIELISESESKVLCSTDLILQITRDPELDIELRLDEST